MIELETNVGTLSVIGSPVWSKMSKNWRAVCAGCRWQRNAAAAAGDGTNRTLSQL